METIIKVSQLQKKYKGKAVLKNVSFSCGEGILGILGENGAGKSTLLKIIATALKADEGCVEICDPDVEKRVGTVHSDIGYLPQEFDFFSEQRLYEGMEYIAMLKGLQKPYCEEIDKLLRMVNLYEQRNKLVGELSGGMKQRFGIAQCLLGRPAVIILDEPTAGLDPGERIHFRNMITSLDWRCCILISSHIVGDMELLCDNIILLKQGDMIFNGSQEEALLKVQHKVIVVEQDAKEPIIWGKHVVSARKNKNMAQVRMIYEHPGGMKQLPANAAYVSPTLEDFYFYKMHIE